MKPLFNLITVGVVALSLADTAFSATIRIVNGNSKTSEPSFTTAISTNLPNYHTGAGYTVVVPSSNLSSFASFNQIWENL